MSKPKIDHHLGQTRKTVFTTIFIFTKPYLDGEEVEETRRENQVIF